MPLRRRSPDVLVAVGTGPPHGGMTISCRDSETVSSGFVECRDGSRRPVNARGGFFPNRRG
jgi:glycyl-tRNA synthetase alpha subunit